MAIIRSRDFIEDGIPVELIANCIKEHQGDMKRLDMLDDYYLGNHAILDRPKDDVKDLPNNKLVANHAKYITDVITGYVFGNPIQYEGEMIDSVLEVFKAIDITSHDSELAKDLSVFGRGLELYFMSSDEVPIPKAAVIDPRQIFLVVDDTVEYKPMFGVHYYEKQDIDAKVIGYNVFVYTPTNTIHYFIESLEAKEYKLILDTPHFWEGVPITEYSNNEEQQGDYEQQISLIDAYNVLQSDRINDKEQLVDALLMVSGVSFGDTEDEQTESVVSLMKHKILELPKDATAGWLVKSLDESQVEILKDSIREDIHRFAMVPMLSDESFGGNSSGVAMKYKLFGTEQLAVIKERFYIQGLRNRLRMFSGILGIKAKAVGVVGVIITMIRNLPEDDVTLAELVSLRDFVSDETLLNQIRFVDEPLEEIKKVIVQMVASIKRNQEAFGFPMDNPPDSDEETKDVKEDEDEE